MFLYSLIKKPERHTHVYMYSMVIKNPFQAVFYAEQLLEHGGPVAYTRDGPVKLPPPGRDDQQTISR